MAEVRRFLVRTFGCQMNEHDSERIASELAADGMARTDEPGRGRRRRPQHLLHPRERRRQAVRAPRASEVGPGATARAADRGRRLPGPEGPRAAPRAGAVRRRRLRHAQRRQGRGAARARPRPRASRCSRSSTRRVEDEETDFATAMAVRHDQPYAAWVTIQVGCDNSCAFCIVPSVRGPEASRPFGELVGRDRGALGPAGPSRSRCSARTSTPTAAT